MLVHDRVVDHRSAIWVVPQSLPLSLRLEGTEVFLISGENALLLFQKGGTHYDAAQL